ncbi:hypothetical protein [Actinomadura sp. NPDC000600]|uniref:hypothetical protein n=1 Tax=Actinomadura sp. NPDC000600 TaxID=3154262 RepID=UPI00339B30A4
MGIGLALTLAGTAAAAMAPAHADPGPARPRDARATPHDGYRATQIHGERPRPVRPLASARLAKGEQVSITVLDRDGKAPEEVFVTLAPLDGGDWLGGTVVNGRLESEVPAGRYAVMAWVPTGTSNTLVYLPDVQPGDLVLDAREGRPILPRIDRADAGLASAGITVTQRIGGEQSLMTFNDGLDLYVTPTGSAPGLALRAQAIMTKQGSTESSPYVYSLASLTEGRLDEPFAQPIRTGDLAAVRTRYGAEGRPACGGGHVGVDWGDVGIGAWVGVGSLPTTRTEYFTPGFTWSLDSGVTTPDCSYDSIDERSRSLTPPRAGEYTQEWNIGPFTSGQGTAIWSTAGQEPSIAVPMLSTWDSRSALGPYAGTTGRSVLRDAQDRVVYQSDEPGAAYDWPAPPPGDYSLTLDATRQAPWSDHSSTEHTVLRFTVRDDKPVSLPGIRLRTPLDDQNHARPGARQPITLNVPGSTAAPSLQFSVDEGRAWRKVAVRKSGANWTATIRNPSAGQVSLRMTVPGLVDQTVIGAYTIG